MMRRSYRFLMTELDFQNLTLSDLERSSHAHIQQQFHNYDPTIQRHIAPDLLSYLYCLEQRWSVNRPFRDATSGEDMLYSSAAT